MLADALDLLKLRPNGAADTALERNAVALATDGAHEVAAAPRGDEAREAVGGEELEQCFVMAPVSQA